MMIERSEMTVFDWYLFWIAMAIPVVNIIVLIIIMLSPNSNPTLRSMLWAQLILVILITVLFMTVLQPYAKTVLEYITNIYPLNQLGIF